jgi:hypothetical protein
MKAILTIVLALAAVVADAQKYRASFGDMPEAEILEALQMKSYPADTSAQALVLYSRVEAEMLDVGTKVKLLVRIKLYEKTALENFDWLADHVIYARRLGHFSLRGNSYNLVDGKIVRTRLDESGIFKTMHNKNVDKITFTMPKISDGTVVEWEYSETDAFSLPGWNLQFSIPSLYSEAFFTNSFLNFRSDIGGALPVQYETLKAKKVHHWHIANVPAFKEEPYMPHEDLFRSNVQIWTYERSWEKEMQWLWYHRYFGGIIMQQLFLRDKGLELTKDIADPKEKIKAVLNYVKSNVEWNGVEDVFADDSDKVIKNKKGTVADINLMLISMLAKIGIAVNPILLSTRDNGHAHEDIPSFLQFNYVVCQAIVGRDTLYLDATQKGLQYDALPVKCLNTRALNATRDGYKWFTLKPAYKEKITAEGNFVVREDGEMKGKLSFIRDGYAASYARQEYLAMGANYKSGLKESWTIEGKKYQNENVLEQAFHEHYDVTIPDHTTVTGDIIYINPYIFSFEEKNPFVSDQRLFPVEFDTPSEKTLLCNITIPAGYKVEELPQSKVFAIPGNGARATFNFSTTGTQIQVMARVQINRMFFAAGEYDMLKEFYARIFSKQGEQIVLKKAL